MRKRKRKPKGLTFEFEVHGVYKVSFEAVIKATSREDAEEEARHQFEKELGKTGGVFYTDEIDIDENECVMESICAICGLEEKKLPDEDRQRMRGSLEYDHNVEYKFPRKNGENVCWSHLKKPGKFRKQLKQLLQQDFWWAEPHDEGDESP